MHHARVPQAGDVNPGADTVCFCHRDAHRSHHANRRVRLVAVFCRHGVAHDGHQRLKHARGCCGARIGLIAGADAIQQQARVLQQVLVAWFGHVGTQRCHLQSWSARVNEPQ